MKLPPPMLALTLLTGCGLNGDFGRMRTSLQSDDTHAWLGPAVYRPAVQPPWKHQLTDDERRLRDYAYPLIDPPYDRNQWLSALALPVSLAGHGPIRIVRPTPRGCSKPRTDRKPGATAS